MMDGTTPLIALDAAVIDTETTGLDPRSARVVELAMVRVTGGRLDGPSFRRLVIQHCRRDRRSVVSLVRFIAIEHHRQRISIRGHVTRKKLHRHRTMEAGVLSAIDHAHAATAEFRDDPVVRDSGADQGHGVLRV